MKYRIRRIPMDDRVDEFRHDCERIQRIFKAHWDIDVPLEHCAEIWEDYSDGFAAGWLFLPPEDRDLAATLEMYVEREPDEEAL